MHRGIAVPLRKHSSARVTKAPAPCVGAFVVYRAAMFTLPRCRRISNAPSQQYEHDNVMTGGGTDAAPQHW
jgi:hypothetical protein